MIEDYKSSKELVSVFLKELEKRQDLKRKNINRERAMQSRKYYHTKN